VVWTGLIWLRIGTSGQVLWTWQWTFRFHKMAASHEGLSSVELVSQYFSLHSSEWYDKWIMNWKGCGRKRLWPIILLLQHFPGGTEENTKPSVETGTTRIQDRRVTAGANLLGNWKSYIPNTNEKITVNIAYDSPRVFWVFHRVGSINITDVSKEPDSVITSLLDLPCSLYSPFGIATLP
jgi:hypothetical protein